MSIENHTGRCLVDSKEAEIVSGQLIDSYQSPDLMLGGAFAYSGGCSPMRYLHIVAYLSGLTQQQPFIIIMAFDGLGG